MKPVYRLAAVLLTAGIVSIPLSARAAKPAPKKTDASQSITLSKTQTKKLGALTKQANAEITAVQKSKATEAQKRAKISAIMTKYDALELKVLTPDQKKKVLAARAQQRRNGERTMAVAKTLTPAQKKKIEAYRTAFEKKVHALEADKKLTLPQKRARYAQLEAGFEKQVQSVLTVQQRKVLTGK